MNLVRLGHYFVPATTSSDVEAGVDLAGSCRTALVIHVWSDSMVNLAVWNRDGGQEHRTSVDVEAPGTGHDSFHLAYDCPWKR